MKSHFLSVFLVLCIAGCANYNLKIRNHAMIDGKNHADLYIDGQLYKKIKIDSSFQYYGAFLETIEGLNMKRHTFIKSNTEALNILVFKLKKEFHEVNRTKDILDIGYFKSGDRKYRYFINKVPQKKDCFYSKNVLVPVRDEIKIVVQYSEDLNVTGIDCEKWSNPWKLSDEQKEYLKKFNKNSERSIEILY